MPDASPPRPRTVALIVATALFMQNMDSTVLATALPSIAVDLDVNPLHLKLALTSYLLALAVFIPASGWVAERFGARGVFARRSSSSRSARPPAASPWTCRPWSRPASSRASAGP